ncbi:hypothetical protein JCM14469_11430 [Desulfatiferula olefinivorans]
MTRKTLLNTQKQEIRTLITDQGLDPGGFSWVDSPSGIPPYPMVSRLVLTGTDFFYAFDMKGQVHWAFFSPGREACIGSEVPVTWTLQKARFSEWLKDLTRELDTPDPWTEPPEKNGVTSYVVAEPPEKRIDPVQMARRLNALLQKADNPDGRPPVSPIKRYYGKA